MDVMLVVIFRATIAKLDAEYSTTAQRLRELAISEFGCLAFHSAAEGNEEITLSYWPDEDGIRRWRGHPEHVAAQKLGRERWYQTYSVEVARVERAYGY
jgi:heme-degrading monooxygenase HmoA